MKNMQKGFVGIMLLLITVVVIVGGRIYVYTQQNKPVKIETQNSATTSVSIETTFVTESQHPSSSEKENNINMEIKINNEPIITMPPKNKDSVSNICSAITSGITGDLETWGFEVTVYSNDKGEIGGYSATASKATGGSTYYYDENGKQIISASASEMFENESLAESVNQWQNNIQKFPKKNVVSCSKSN